MGKTKKQNQGFSLIELLIAMTILSIVMIMVVQFMSTSSAAYRKQKKNLNIQTEAMTVLENISDTLMQANYVRIQSMDGKMYTISKDASNERVVTEDTSKGTFDYDFVPDNYGNYSEVCTYKGDDRKVIVDFDTFEIVNEQGYEYPLENDRDNNGRAVRSFRALKTDDTYSYIMPRYIYAEYAGKRDDGTETIVHVVYYITDVKDTAEGTRSIHMYRYETDDFVNGMSLNYNFACGQVAIQENLRNDGFLTDNVIDFYISADSDGNALLTNILFKDDGYEYNTVETINFRNSNVLTVRPQKLFKVKGTGVTGGSGASGNSSTEASTEASTETTP